MPFQIQVVQNPPGERRKKWNEMIHQRQPMNPSQNFLYHTAKDLAARIVQPQARLNLL